MARYARAAPKGSLLRRAIVKMLLSVLAGSSAAPQVPILPGQETKLCLSTAVDIKTVTCNLDCNINNHNTNPDSQTCPHACICTLTDAPTEDLSASMPSEVFAKLADEVARSTASSFAARTSTSTTTRVPKAGVGAPAELPNGGEDLYGFYAKTWACKEPFLESSACLGPPDRNIDVVFSGYGSVASALEAVMKQGNRCTPEDMDWCEGQIKFLTDSSVPPMSKAAATKQILSDAATEAKCNRCMEPDGGPKKSDGSGRLQFLTLGGANAEGMVTATALDAVADGLEDVKAAGFHGICFDIELTIGEQDLVDAQERAFAACKKAGLLVMVTTSHSAPYAAGSEASKIALTESWAASDDIDIFVSRSGARTLE